MQESQSRSRWPGMVAVLAVAAAFAAFIFARGDVAVGAQNQPAATQTAPPRSEAPRRHDCPEHGGGGGGSQQQDAPSLQATPGTEL